MPFTHVELHDLLSQCVAKGTVTTYADVSQHAYGNRHHGNQAVPSSLKKLDEELPDNGVTHRVVREDGGCPLGNSQRAQLRAEGVPFVGDNVDVARCRATLR
ncbi:MAG: cysteine methyltransferase [Polyangiaceae bacterium]